MEYPELLYFKNATEWRQWLHDNHLIYKKVELVFYRVDSKFESIKNYFISQFRGIRKMGLGSSTLKETVDKEGWQSHKVDIAKSVGYALIDGIKLGGALGLALATLQALEMSDRRD